ncbi:helix-turn-helix domain-containing protein [Mycobacterium cookii]|uniref:Helix-turn-helix domain-containing protein n=1 Tax=Nocardioides furvisabuli TaxID=375542 RepID=A0ABN2WYP9_9ACTN|nr:helix-turn-helix domain-containing protein [Nocardioides furvisabuli]
MGQVLTEHYDLNGVPEADKEGRWEEILSSTHVDLRLRISDEPMTRSPKPFRATARRMWIDDLALVDVTCDPCSGVRSASRIKGADLDYVVILINLRGREVVSQHDAAAEMRAGDAVVWDTTRPVKFRVLEPLAKRSLFVPRSALDEIGARSLGIAGAILGKDAPATELLTSYLDVLARTVDQLSPAAVAAARNATLDLVSAALQPEQVDEPLPRDGAALRASINRWIEHNLDGLDLSPSTIALAHNVSVRSVHRLFEGSGATVVGFVRTRRLARARQDLVSSNASITEIAARWRFYDPSHFTRAFRAQYGVSPSHFRTDPGRQGDDRLRALP